MPRTVCEIGLDNDLECERLMKYSKERLECADLMMIRDFALDFFRKWPYCSGFEKELLAIALCQGAANHFVVCQGMASKYFDTEKSGIKDLDIWFFFKKTDGKRFNPRWQYQQDLGPSKFGNSPDDVGYRGRRVDFFGRSIISEEMGIEDSIKYWLHHGGGRSPGLILQKAVIGLYPEEILCKPIWINPKLI